eukprot:TRINITY_DN1260_c0_g1_i1.p1 TRINITY_DN1260_c0_g1~~TRINITY_DN1260_c0_g1_i1.p1  ORF type:complete len:111 (+),score=3.32 TRINITY_DN1260_c0_g1_i1:389-721(+)
MSPSGKLFVATDQRIYRYNSSSLFMNGAPAEHILSGISTDCQEGGIWYIQHMSFDQSDNLWVTDQFRNRVFEIASASTITAVYPPFRRILGQPDATTCIQVPLLNQLKNP